MAVQTLTYGDKQFLNQNADIPATNKVEDTDMNEIKQVVNNNATILQGETTYSLNEVDTGKTWIDNKPIYRKTIQIPSFSNSEITVNTEITNIDNITNIEGSFKRSGTETPYFYSIDNTLMDEWRIDYNTGEMTIKTNNSYVTFTGYLTFEYTKTS